MAQRQTRSYKVSLTDIHLKGLVYGDPGSGKTTFCASAEDHPAMRDVVVGNIEGGLLSIAHRGDIRAVDLNSTEEVDELFWQIIKDKESGQGEFATINTVILDNVTELQTINLQEIVDDARANGRTGPTGTRDNIWQEDYGKSTNQIKRIFRQFRMAPINFIATAHAKKVFPKGINNQQIAGAEPLAVIPSLTQKLAESVMGYVDFVWYFFYDAEQFTYNLLTRTEDIYFAKTRGPRFKEELGQVRVIPATGALAEIYEIYLQSTSREHTETRRIKKRA